MSALQPFSPHYGTNQVLTAAAAAATANIDPVDKEVRIINNGANIAYIRISRNDNVVAATTADLPILNGMSTTITKADGQDRLSYISALGTTLQVMTGEGW
jgi:hypothetical protein